jgi:hypothetical protein
VIGLDQALVNQRGDQIQHIRLAVLVGAGDGFGAG